jgi:acetyltransferase-like isoleucine patch superfamily enzyme
MSKIFTKGWGRIKFIISYYLIHKADPVSYLRAQGAVIGENCDLICGIWGFGSEPYLIHIGNNVTLAGGVNLITHDGGTRVFRPYEPRWTKETGNYGKISIGDNVFIGMNAIIMPGVRIDSNVVIGAGSVVTKNVSSNTVFAGNPAHFIHSLDEYREKSIQRAIQLSNVSPAIKKQELIRFYWPK